MNNPSSKAQGGWRGSAGRVARRLMRPLALMKRTNVSPTVSTEVAAMLRLTQPDNSNPNINDLWRLTKDLEATKLTVKFFGYELARALMVALPPLPGGGPFQASLTCRPATQLDLESPWTRYWSAQLKERHTIHRRVWEYAFVLQALAHAGKLRPGMKGLELGSGNPVASYLASKGCEIVAVDSRELLPDQIFRDALLDRGTFDSRVRTRVVNFSAMPRDLRDFDFCWSVGKLQHVGSLSRGMSLIENVVDALKPGGVMVHTTEFNFAIPDQTIDNWGTVLFQRRHFEEVAQRLEKKGCRVLPLDFNVGAGALDRFIDVPPFEMPTEELKDWSRDVMHIKVSLDGFPCTSFGLVAVRN
jgi:SAM-dependent methyltransferase